MKNFGGVIFCTLFMTILAACAAGPDAASIGGEPSADYFADNGLGNAVAVVQHPAGIYHKGVTYVAYQGPLEDPYVAAYDHKAQKWSGPYKAGTSDMGKDPTRKIDNHGKPTLIIDDLGYLHVFFGGHGGMDKHGPNPLGNKHYGTNKHAVSKHPLDITGWETLDTIPPFGTYNQVVKMDNGDIYLFYRHGAHRSDWVYHVSKDHGRSFSEAISFMKHKRRDDLEAVDSWYPWVGRGKGDEIIVSFDYHLCWDRDARPGRGHTANREDLFYMTFNTKTGAWQNVKDEPLNIPLTREEAEVKTLVADLGDLWTFNGAAALDPSGRPHLLINAGEDKGTKIGGPKLTRHYRWTGDKWAGGQTIGTPGGRGVIDVHSPAKLSVYASYTEDGDGVVARWDSADSGETFTEAQELLRRPGASFAITSLIENPHPGARLIVAERRSETDDRRMYLLGDSGPVGRSSP